MLPVAKSNIDSPWETFEQAKAAFDNIIVHETTREELTALHFDPFKTPNIEILTYLDIIQRFMPNSSITKEDIDAGLRTCIAAKNNCQAYEIALHKIKSQRYGNLFLDLFKFKRRAHQTGWNFSALIVIKDDVVVYKLWGGKPQIDETLYQKNPLGPLQEPASVAEDAAIISTF